MESDILYRTFRTTNVREHLPEYNLTRFFQITEMILIEKTPKFVFTLTKLNQMRVLRLRL